MIMNSDKNKIWGAIISLCGALLMLSAIGLLVIAVYPFQVFDVQTPLKVLTPVVNQGECVFAEVNYTKHVSVPATFTAELITKEGWIVTSQLLSSNLPPGKHSVVLGFQLPRLVNTPTKAETVTAHMKITASYSVFGVRNVVVKFATEDFKIKKHTGCNYK